MVAHSQRGQGKIMFKAKLFSYTYWHSCILSLLFCKISLVLMYLLLRLQHAEFSMHNGTMHLSVTWEPTLINIFLQLFTKQLEPCPCCSFTLIAMHGVFRIINISGTENSEIKLNIVTTDHLIQRSVIPDYVAMLVTTKFAQPRIFNS